jgi:hypothetical protein
MLYTSSGIQPASDNDFSSGDSVVHGWGNIRQSSAVNVWTKIVSCVLMHCMESVTERSVTFCAASQYQRLSRHSHVTKWLALILKELRNWFRAIIDVLLSRM